MKPMIQTWMLALLVFFPVDRGVAADVSDDSKRAARLVEGLSDRWKEETKNVPIESKSGFQKSARAMQDLFDHQTEDDRNVVAHYVASHADEFEKKAAFESMLSTATIGWLVKSGQDEQLVILFSRACPNRVYGDEAEFFLLSVGARSLRDPFLIFFDAYQGSKSDENREQIQRVLERSLRPVGVSKSTGAKFVAEARRWYQRNRGNLRLNPSYRDLVRELDEEAPLFHTVR